MIRVVNLSNSAFDPPIYSAFCAFPRNNHFPNYKNKDRFIADLARSDLSVFREARTG